MPYLTDIFRQHGDGYMAAFADGILSSHRKAIRSIVDCRTSAMDGFVACCTDCGATQFYPFSCGNRACPSCHDAKRLRWLLRREAELLPGVTYFHVVFTVPAELREFARSHQKEFFTILFAAAVESIKTLAADPRHLGGKVGMLAVLHTWTRTLGFHPHIHMLIPGIALLPDGDFIRKDRFLIPIEPLRTLFRAKFITKLKQTFAGADLPYVDPQKKWNIHIKDSSSHPETVLNYLARYVYGQAIDDSRILAVENGQVTFSYKRDFTRRTMTLALFEFMRRYLQHTLPQGFHRVRFYGLCHSAYRDLLDDLRLRLYRQLRESPPPKPPSSTRLPCPRCNSPMFILYPFVRSEEIIYGHPP